ncbi:SMC-Scp complex subunit ScpB [uncultured Clostridium sp.]|jgi:segregation and condensation protein B|uniref:SMC-Scp complex subunit ScpB n=1 Tax=uncultured Clostridium sp. TaxID=59620 RepID=UPI00261CD7FA|nr:SMC-Scp complex subunit ScpB [uncultured Clostridium sp.]
MSNYSEQIEFEEISNKNKIYSIIESLLFVTGEPLSVNDISKIIKCNFSETLSYLKEMTIIFETTEERGLKIISVNGKYQLVTKNENSAFIQKLLKKNTRQSLSQASLESLSIIAYKQPITRIEIDEIRGVKSDSAIQRLVEKNLVEETGRKEVVGKPILYGTTDEFLRHFALTDIEELPSLELYAEAEIEEEN